VQNYCTHPEGGWSRNQDASAFFVANLRDKLLPNVSAARGAEIEVLYSVIETIAQNGRDRSLDYRIVAPGSWDTRVVDAIAPPGGEMVFHKTSSNDFDSTNTGVTA
jgi:ureidoacrylate peracid hydrolase